MARKKVLIIGEKINAAANKKIKEMVENKDAGFIKNLVLEQAAQGADVLDICAGEKEDMVWLVETVQEISILPLCFDSPDPEIIAAGLEVYHSLETPFINSVDLGKIEEISVIAKKYKAKVVALATLGKMEPEEERKDIAKSLVTSLLEKGLKRKDIYVDPGVYAVAIDQNQAQIVINLIRFVKEELKAKTVTAPSNISFGLAARRILNKVFFAMLKEAKIDAVIIDPACPKLKIADEDLEISKELLEGKDARCRKFLRHFRRRENA